MHTSIFVLSIVSLLALEVESVKIGMSHYNFQGNKQDAEEGRHDNVPKLKFEGGGMSLKCRGRLIGDQYTFICDRPSIRNEHNIVLSPFRNQDAVPVPNQSYQSEPVPERISHQPSSYPKAPSYEPPQPVSTEIKESNTYPAKEITQSNYNSQPTKPTVPEVSKVVTDPVPMKPAQSYYPPPISHNTNPPKKYTVPSPKRPVSSYYPPEEQNTNIPVQTFIPPPKRRFGYK